MRRLENDSAVGSPLNALGRCEFISIDETKAADIGRSFDDVANRNITVGSLDSLLGQA